MPYSKSSPADSPKIVWLIVVLGATLGLILSWGVLSGDQQGRVNLLYLLFLYVLLPIASLLISLASLLGGKGINFARLVIALPLWTEQQQSFIRKSRQLNLQKPWLLQQSQAAALAFSCASLLVFFMLLLATDINFVWRSTLLDATDLLPFLNIIALPWGFWDTAQPSLQLLQATQDSRLLITGADASLYAGWWQFILATQLFYSLLPRALVLVAARLSFTYQARQDLESRLQQEISRHPVSHSKSYELAPVVTELPSAIAITNWAGVELSLLSPLAELDLRTDNLLIAGPLATQEQQASAESWHGEQLVVVKAWEPPLGELLDFLQHGRGYLLPLDWDKTGLKPPRHSHLQEWQRFISQLPQWRIFLPQQLG